MLFFLPFRFAASLLSGFIFICYISPSILAIILKLVLGLAIKC